MAAIKLVLCTLCFYSAPALTLRPLRPRPSAGNDFFSDLKELPSSIGDLLRLVDDRFSANLANGKLQPQEPQSPARVMTPEPPAHSVTFLDQANATKKPEATPKPPADGPTIAITPPNAQVLTPPYSTGVRDFYSVPKCQVPQNLTFCTGVNYPTPFYGWGEWEKYLDDTLAYNMEDGDWLKDDEKIRDIYIFFNPGPGKRDNPYACRDAMKAIGCALYFPKCDPKSQDKLPPCRRLCNVFNSYDCPGGNSFDCHTKSPQTSQPHAVFSESLYCTDYAEVRNTTTALSLPAVPVEMASQPQSKILNKANKAPKEEKIDITSDGSSD